jgi:hypothetical protein
VHDGGSFQLLGSTELDPWAELGRGVPLMSLLVDEVALETGSEGTVVRFSKRRGTSRISGQRRRAVRRVRGSIVVRALAALML